VSGRELERARRTLLTRHESDTKDNGYLLGLLTHCQAADVPRKSAAVLADVSTLYNAVTVEDLYDAYGSLALGPADVFTCTGVSGSTPPPPAPAPAAPSLPPGILPDPRALEAAFAALGGSGVLAEWQARFAADRAAAQVQSQADRAQQKGDGYL
jgi:hypothetical protein